MREKLSRRLDHLEQLHAAAMRAKAAEPRPGSLTAAQVIQIRLGLRGFFPIGNERWAEVTARIRDKLSGSSQSFGGPSGGVQRQTEFSIEQASQRRTPPGTVPAARFERRRLSFDRVAALAIVALRGLNRQPHLLSQRSADEATQRMRLPAGRLQQFFGGRALRPLQQLQDGRRFAALPGVVSGASGRFLLRGGLLPRLGLGGRDVGATCPSGGLFRALRLGCLRLFRDHVFSLAVITA